MVNQFYAGPNQFQLAHYLQLARRLLIDELGNAGFRNPYAAWGPLPPTPQQIFQRRGYQYPESLRDRAVAKFSVSTWDLTYGNAYAPVDLLLRSIQRCIVELVATIREHVVGDVIDTCELRKQSNNFVEFKEIAYLHIAYAHDFMSDRYLFHLEIPYRRTNWEGSLIPSLNE